MLFRSRASNGAIPPFTVGEVAPRGSVAPKSQTTSVTNADNGVSWARWSALWAQRRLTWRAAREPLTMRVNPVTRTPTPRYAPGRRRRACHQTPTRIRGPTRESADPRADRGPAPVIADPGAKCRIHVRGEERRQLARLEQFRMQFDWVNLQQYLQTLQFQRYGCAVRHSVGGIEIGRAHV